MDPVKIVVCMDSWKGSMDAATACRAVAEGLREALPEAEVVELPLADGGEGTLELARRARPGELCRHTVCGPLPDRRVRAAYLLWPGEQGALIEMAVCAGLTLLTDHELDPLRATTRGVGELMREAARRGVRHLLLAVGGSATVDGGTGMASGMGWRFLDADGGELPPGGGALRRLRAVVPPETRPDLEVEVMCDVTNPLLGDRGAAAVFAPQKGAGPRDVEMLEEGLARLAEVLRRDLGVEVAGLAGGGAAGGVAAGAVAFWNARLVSGVNAVMDLSGLAGTLEGADWVVTGEGRLDGQSLDGKVVSGVLERAGRAGVAVAVVAGSREVCDEVLTRRGIRHALTANRDRMPLEEAMRRAAPLARGAGFRLGRELKRGRGAE